MPIKLAWRITMCASLNHGSKLPALSDGGEAVIGRRAYSCYSAPRVGPRGPRPLAVCCLFFCLLPASLAFAGASTNGSASWEQLQGGERLSHARVNPWLGQFARTAKNRCAAILFPELRSAVFRRTRWNGSASLLPNKRKRFCTTTRR